MCDYSLENALWRPARVGDKVITRRFSSGTRGFAVPQNCAMAVCMLPGTELAFSSEVTFRPPLGWWRRTEGHTTAVFRRVNKDRSQMHHDALEFPNGRIVLLHHLFDGQEGTVLQLPAQTTAQAEVGWQIHAEYAA